jgi:hypothetical protein
VRRRNIKYTSKAANLVSTGVKVCHQRWESRRTESRKKKYNLIKCVQFDERKQELLSRVSGRRNLPSSGVSSRVKSLGLLTREDGTDTLSRNVGKQLPHDAV